MQMKAGGGFASGSRQKRPWLMCIRCSNTGGKECVCVQVLRMHGFVCGPMGVDVAHLVRVERHINRGDAIEVGEDKCLDPLRVSVRAGHRKGTPDMEVDLKCVVWS